MYHYVSYSLNLISPPDVQTIDFANSQETANEINAWCANVTKNRIQDIVKPSLFAIFPVY